MAIIVVIELTVTSTAIIIVVSVNRNNKNNYQIQNLSVITASIINLLLLLFIILFKSSGRALLFRGGNVTVTTLLIRLLFLIRTSRDYITRPLDVSTLDILALLLPGSSSFLSFVSLNKRQLTRLLVPNYVLMILTGILLRGSLNSVSSL